MSKELNVYHHELRHNEYDEFYLKYEADKVISDLEESHKMEVEQLLMEIVELKEAQRWRKFPDEKPTEDIKFLVINEKGFIQCCYYSPIFKEFQIPVTHWMPLPKVPECKELAEKFKEAK